MSSRRKNNKLVDLLSSPGGFQMTQAFTSPITSRLKGGLFNPLEFNPYLLFDAQTSMLGELEAPTLDLDASDESTLDVITATRAGVATYTDLHGVIQTASADTVRVDHVQGEELTPTKFQKVGYTDFSSGWFSQQVTTSAGGGYLGQPSVIVERTAGASQSLFHDFFNGYEYEANTNYTFSFWIRAVSGSFSVYANTYPAPVTSGNDLLNLTTEWQKVAVTFNSASLTWLRTGIWMHDSGSSVGDAFEIAMPQVEEGTTASDFVPNTTGSPKFIASATYEPRVPMMLIEPSATNLLPYSEDFGSWTELNTTVTVNDSLAPDGNQTADKITADSGSASKRITSYAATDSSTDYTVSFYAKAGSHQFVQTYIANNGAIYANFDLISGQSQAFGGTTSKMTLAANGFYRCEFTFTGAATLAAGYFTFADSLTHARADSSSSTGNFYLWGAQVELGSVATSYIPTSGSAVTRNADNLVIDGTAFSDFYNATEGTVYVEAVPRDGVNEFPYYFEFSNGTTANRHHSYRSGASANYFAAYINGGSIFNDGIGSITLDTLNRISYSYKNNDYLGSANGATTVTHTGPVPAGITQLLLGDSVANNPRLMTGRIKRLLYWPTHSSSL